MPYDGQKWPDDGEIDIMERLNNDSIAFQTVHSNYTYTLGRDKDPVSSLTSPINRDDFNVYGVDMYPTASCSISTANAPMSILVSRNMPTASASSRSTGHNIC